MYYVKSLEQIPLFLQMVINFSQATINTKLMKFTVLYWATMKGGKRLLRQIVTVR